VLLTVAVVGVAIGLDSRRHEPAADTEAAPHQATGVIRSFGADRSYVNIAHDPIEGFMQAMTMAFEFRNSAQSTGLEVGDHVQFTFVSDRQGRLVIASISKGR